VSPAVSQRSQRRERRRLQRAARAGGCNPSLATAAPPRGGPGGEGTSPPGSDFVDRRRKPDGGYYSPADLPEIAGKHCHHCYELGQRDWWIWCWPKSSIEQSVRVRIPYRCQSWRCPVCSIQERHVLFARMHQAIEGYDPAGWCLLVLTIDREGYYSGEKPFHDTHEAYRGLQKMSQRFFEELRREILRHGWPPLEKQWVSTVECHRTGWPHMNILIWHPDLANWLREERRARLSESMTQRESILVSRWLLDITTRTGWGLQSTAEAARCADTVASYITKLAGDQDRTLGEVAKLSQLPVMAPLRFRRIRSGRHFLPPREKGEGYTGTLIRRTYAGGCPQILTVHQLKDYSAQFVQEQVAAWEGNEWERELAQAYQLREMGKAKASRMVGLPPITYWVGGKRLANVVSVRRKDTS
jgi:hypothetical protein